MSTIELLVPPTPAHVRTASVVAVAAARRAGLPEDVLDEVRLGVSEACARAVSVHLLHAPRVPVKLVMCDDGRYFTATITDAGPAPAAWDAPIESLIQQSPSDPRVPLAFLAGLVEDMSISVRGKHTAVRLRWVHPRVAV